MISAPPLLLFVSHIVGAILIVMCLGLQIYWKTWMPHMELLRGTLSPKDAIKYKKQETIIFWMFIGVAATSVPSADFFGLLVFLGLAWFTHSIIKKLDDIIEK